MWIDEYLAAEARSAIRELLNNQVIRDWRRDRLAAVLKLLDEFAEADEPFERAGKQLIVHEGWGWQVAVEHYDDVNMTLIHETSPGDSAAGCRMYVSDTTAQAMASAILEATSAVAG